MTSSPTHFCLTVCRAHINHCTAFSVSLVNTLNVGVPYSMLTDSALVFCEFVFLDTAAE